MNTTPASFQTILDTLLSDRPDFPRRYLQEFSDLGPLELKTLLEVWPRVKPSRKLTLLEELDALAEADTLVSFDDLARALLTDPRILILDDSTSAVDSATEDQIQRAIKTVLEGRTTLLITHRLSQIRRADRILVLHRSEIVDQGSHEELMERCDLYRRIFARYE